MDLLKFFIENNNSGAKTKESFLKKNYPELYLDIINYTNNDLINLPFKQKIWHFINKTQNQPKCQNCGNLLYKKSLK